MNNELFDRMIKENLQEMQVAPSAGVKKALGWKLFFQNMVVFHKVKVALGLLLVSGATTYYFVAAGNTNEENLIGTGELVAPFFNGDFTANNLIAVDEISNEIELELIEKNAVEVEKLNDATIINDKASKEATSNDINESTDLTSEKAKVSKELKTTNESLSEVEGETTSSESELLAEEKILEDANSENKAELTDATNNDLGTATAANEEIANEFVNSFESFTPFNKGVSRPSLIENGLALSGPNENIQPIPFLSNERGMFGELSFDLYKGLMGQSQISSDLRSAIHNKYYWDFHGEDEMLKMNVLGGLNVNYTYGARVFRIKASTGLSYYTVNDNKAVYEFEEITDPLWLNFFQTDELAWVNTYGEDTCTQCFYAHNTEELQAELEKEHNQYSYLRVPLQLGTQFNFKYVSLDLLGGVDMNFLTKSQGLYVKEGLQENYERFYFWDEMQLSTLSKGNEMLRKSFMTWSLVANLRVRITKNFDLLAGYQLSNSFGNIAESSYLMKKNLKSSNLKVGLTFYPTRTKLKPKFGQ